MQTADEIMSLAIDQNSSREFVGFTLGPYLRAFDIKANFKAYPAVPSLESKEKLTKKSYKQQAFIGNPIIIDSCVQRAKKQQQHTHTHKKNNNDMVKRK